MGSGWRRQAERATPVCRSRHRNRPDAQSPLPLTVASDRGLLDLDLRDAGRRSHAPDHTTLSRRGQYLALARRRARPGTSLPLIVDSTGLSIVGEGEWAAATHGGRGRRGWRKLHLGVDGSRVIVACALTEPTADDAITGISLVDEVDGHLTRVTADPAYDTLAFTGAAGARGARVVVPPTKTASVSRRGARSGARDRTTRRVKALGRRRWKKASGDHPHARVEHAFFRYTSIVGDCLRARSSSGPRREAVLACHVLNRMTELGRPVSYRIGRGRARRFEARRPARIRAPTPLCSTKHPRNARWTTRAVWFSAALRRLHTVALWSIFAPPFSRPRQITSSHGILPA